MLTIIQSESKAWAVAATNGDLRIFGREQVGEWTEVLLSGDSEQLEGDGSLILEALYDQHAGSELEEEGEEPEAEEDEDEAEEDEEEPEAEQEEDEPEEDEEEDEPEEDEEEDESEEDEEPGAEEEEQKPRRRRSRTRAKKK